MHSVESERHDLERFVDPAPLHGPNAIKQLSNTDCVESMMLARTSLNVG
jgi:hypothetical protein